MSHVLAIFNDCSGMQCPPSPPLINRLVPSFTRSRREGKEKQIRGMDFWKRTDDVGLRLLLSCRWRSEINHRNLSEKKNDNMLDGNCYDFFQSKVQNSKIYTTILSLAQKYYNMQAYHAVYPEYHWVALFMVYAW